MALKLAKLAGLALTVASWLWVPDGQRSDAWNMAIIWCAPLFAYPITVLARRALDAQPSITRAVWVNVLLHYAMMISLGVAIFLAIRLVSKWPGATIPIPRALGLVCMVLAGIATILTVLNLAVRGLGAPFAANLSSRLATDWMYAWTRNPMILATLSLLLSVGLWYRSVWFLLWVAAIVSPGVIFFVRKYEERELEVRFGSAYRDYRLRTPFLWPRNPSPVTRQTRNPQA